MRKFALYISVLILIAAAGYSRVFAEPCSRPIEYSIGTFDSKFGITKEQFLADVKMGESLWEKAAGKELFNYDQEAKFKVNLVYDERQRSVLQKQRTESGLQAAEETFRSADQKFALIKSSYESQAAAYESRVAEFKKAQAEYEARVSYWNGHGGANQNEYRKMEEERRRLNAIAESLNTEAADLNKQNAELNSLLKVRNQAAENYNSLVRSYNTKFASGLEFDQAEYRDTGGKQEINVYEFRTREDLRFALAHELGHALGLDHVENNVSVMYYMSGGQNKFALSAEDLAELKNVCTIK